MNSNSLTAAEAALYFGHMVKVRFWDSTKTKIVWVYGSFLSDYWEGKYAVAQLILRPLADITEEEAIEFAELTYEGTVYNFRLYGSQAFWSMHHGPEDVDLDIDFDDKFYFNPKSFAYLLSKGFDLFNWIEQGKALDKTKLNQHEEQ